MFILLAAPVAWAQRTQGSVTVAVVDPSGAVVPGAQLKLTDLATNDTRQATTQEAGTYTFVNLNFGNHKLTVSKQGFETMTFDVVVQAARNTDVKATLRVGAAETVVQVEGGATPLVETTTNAINSTIDMKQIEDLPLGGRNINQLSQLAAGYNGTWNGLPSTAQGNTIDGVVGNTSRWRYGSTNSANDSGVTPRLENIAEMVVSTDQLDLNSGWGNSTMHITYVTRRGSNQIHGRFYEDHRNSALNAPGWCLPTAQNPQCPKSKFHLNEFGGSVGGPIMKDKLFFFASFSMFWQPGQSSVTRNFPTSQAQQGRFAYGANCNATTGANCYYADILGMVGAYNLNLAHTVNPMSKARLDQVNGWMNGQGILWGSRPSDPNLLTWQWMYSNPNKIYYPTFRIDYNLSQNWRLNFAYNQTKQNRPTRYADHWPGDGRGAGSKSNAVAGSFGLETTLSPTLINQVKLGYLYTASWFGINGDLGFFDHPETNYTVINYNYGNINNYWEMPNSRLQPVVSLSDTASWMRGSHTFTFGFSGYRDQNRYWDPPEGFNIIDMGLNTNDPARQAFTAARIQAAAGAGAPTPSSTDLSRARSLYAMLTGDISHLGGRHAYNTSTGQYRSVANGDAVGSSTLDEVMKVLGVSLQDSWKMKRNLTINYGMRWDFITPDTDRSGKYHSAGLQDVWGPTAAGALFQPGTLGGTNAPAWTYKKAAYGAWNVTPQPALGIAWNPRSSGSFVERLLGGEKTVVRASFALRRFTEPQQFVWDLGSSYAIGFYQTFTSVPDAVGTAPGTFRAGSLHLGDTIPASLFYSNPLTFDKVLPLSQQTFSTNYAFGGVNPNIRQPYTESWNLGFQRELGPSRALEVRYAGNRTVHQWLAQNINEVNIFENGFLQEFQHAQANLALNGGTSFAKPATGGFDLPIMTAAGVNFADATFIENLQYGRAGDFAWTLANDRTLFCNQVGSSFGPCNSTNPAKTLNGQPIPINFWMVNPYAIGSWMADSYMTDNGYSNYHALQIEFRQRQWHGATMTANYTWSKNLGVATSGDWTGSFNQFTLRNIRANYAPTSTDRNHVIHVNATFDLPVGKGKQFLNRAGIVDKVLGGWTVSTIVTFQSGTPFRIYGQNSTFSDVNDGGVVLNGITAADFQKHMGHFIDSADGNRRYYLDPAWIDQIKAGANPAIASNTTPGTFATMLWLHGPHQTYTDIGISKSAAITERVRFKFQTSMLNAFNHPTFAQSDVGIDSTTFGRASQTAGSRSIEFRANLEF